MPVRERLLLVLPDREIFSIILLRLWILRRPARGHGGRKTHGASDGRAASTSFRCGSSTDAVIRHADRFHRRGENRVPTLEALLTSDHDVC